MRLYSFKVIGFGAFPIDMLRYDQCWPTGSDDANAIQSSIEDRAKVREKKTISLTGYGNGPTPGRWDSFMWKITKVN